MPRVKSESRTALVDSALKTFWKTGYHVVSMSDLVRETGVSRGGIYSDFSGKQDLFHACLDRYQEVVVTPAFAPVEAEGAGIDAIGDYLNNLLNRVKDGNDPGLGCLVVNTIGQIEPEDEATRARLDHHSSRLVRGFKAAITHENQKSGTLSDAEIITLANFTMVSVQGLWGYSRARADLTFLRDYCDTLIKLLKSQVQGADG